MERSGTSFIIGSTQNLVKSRESPTYRLAEISPLGYFKLEDGEESRIPLYITRLVPFVRDL